MGEDLASSFQNTGLDSYWLQGHGRMVGIHLAISKAHSFILGICRCHDGRSPIVHERIGEWLL